MSDGKTIRKYLVDGTAEGLRIINISGFSITAFASYKHKIQDLLAREKQIKKYGAYILIGESDENQKLKFYIGETDNFRRRIIQQIKDRDFWSQCVVFNSMDDSFGKTEVQWLESELYTDFSNAGNVEIQNDKMGKIKLSESKTNDMMKYKENVYLILGALGYENLHIAPKPKIEKSKETSLQDYTFYCKRKREGSVGVVSDSYMVQISNGFKVLKGSKIHKENELYASEAKNEKIKRNMASSYRRREDLIADGKLVKDGDLLILKEDQIFKTISGASNFVVGMQTAGKDQWKTKINGKDVKYREIEAEYINSL